MSTEVLVVGGGPAGLTAALLAARAGHEVTLVEAADRLGGMSASTTVAGQRVDLGSHRLHPSASPGVRALLDELLGEDLQVRQRRGRLRLDDRWVRFPLEPGDLARQLPPLLAARIAGDLLLGSIVPGRTGRGGGHRDGGDADTSSYADVVRERLGATVLEAFHGPYARKLWGVEPTVLAGDLARRRIAMRGAGDVLARLRRTATPAGRTFLYPRLGYGQIVDRLAEAAVDAGATIRTGVRPGAVRPAAQGGRPDTPQPVEVVLDGTTTSAGRVLWTAPPTALAAVAGLDAPALRHRGVVLTYLAVAADRYLPWDAHYVPDESVPFVRLSEPKNYREGPDPSGVTVLCAEVPCTAGDQVWGADDAALGQLVVDGMRRLGLPAPVVTEVATVRLPAVYPLLTVDDVEDVRASIGRVEALPGITVLGRQGLGVADNLHHVVEMARAAVACLGPGGRWDDDRWARARRAFDAFVVED